MAVKIFSCSFTGLNCRIIEVQVDVCSGMPNFSIVGLGDASVQESKERVHSSIKNSGFIFPPNRKIVNLAPAQVKKQGSLFDFPIAIGILLASGQITSDIFGEAVLIGELSLSGQIKAVNGVLPIVQCAKKNGFKKIFLPKENVVEASFIDEIEIYPVEDLKKFIGFCKGKINIEKFPNVNLKNFVNESKRLEKFENTFSKIIGLEKQKRALAISASGHHSCLLSGSPGCGKTILGRAFKDLLTEMETEEILETTKIFSVAGLLNPENPIVASRPFREVHHTASLIALVGGGGVHPRPGEISFAHNGVLFLDEIAEFQKSSLEAMRQPLEDKFITINRANFSVKFPCNFILMATMNPCPCGYKGDKKITCKCTDAQVRNYQKKLSGPLLDRFDIFLDVEKVSMKNIFEPEDVQKILPIYDSIKMAQIMQKKRFKNTNNMLHNCEMGLNEIQKYCGLDKEAKNILDKACEYLNLSNRGYLRTIKIARTIADMEGAEEIKTPHIAEALQYRVK